MGKKLINVAVIEPSYIVFEGLANILLRSKVHFQLYRFENAEEYELSAPRIDFDVLLINPVMIQNLPKVTQQLKRVNERTSWIALVYSFFPKELLSQFDTLIRITDDPDDIADLLYRQAQQHEAAADATAAEQITERETEVLKLLVKGLPNKEIADKLNISIHTVISHRKNIIQKTGIRSQAGLTIYAISNKIISLDHMGE